MLNWLKKQFSSTSNAIPAKDVSVQLVNAGDVLEEAVSSLSGLAEHSYRDGKLSDAARYYQQALEAQPDDANLNNKLGDVFYDQQDYGKAEIHYRRALQIQADFPEAELNLGLTLDAIGQFDGALACYEHVIKLQPANYLAYFNLAVTLTSLSKPEEARSAYQKVLELKPGFSHAHFNLATLLQRHDLQDEAEEHYLRTIEANPQHFAAYCNLGVIYQAKRQFAQAKEQYQQALRIHPQHAETHHNLGLVACDLRQTDLAITHFRQALNLRPDFAEAMISLGDAYRTQNRLSEAEASYRQAIAMQPKLPGAYCNLGIILHERKQYLEAIAIYQQGIANDAHSVLLYNNLGNTYSMVNRLSDAEACYDKALQIGSDVTETYTNLAGLFAGQGKLEEAENSYRQAVKLDPGYAQAYSNLLFMLNYDPDRSAEEIFAAYQDYEKRYANRYRSECLPFDNDKNRHRRLKIGYVSPDFSRHPVQYFLEPLMCHHDKNLFEVYAYAQLSVADGVTERYQSYADHWIETGGLTDAALAERIRHDEIDILVDLAGHTANNRLSVFARRPAPIQVSWLGYGYTTGLTAIDYFLSDDVSAPAGSDALFAEQPWRIPAPSYAYRPAPGMGEVSLLPAFGNGHVRIGTLTRSIRINHRTIRVWSEILKRLKNAVLVVDSANYQDVNLRQSLLDKFAAQGIDESRLDIGFHSPPWNTLRALDIGLDCFPHNSGTTLFETLYMGVPFVTLAGRPSLGRLGSCILEGLGRPEWIAHTEDDYVEKVVTLAENVEQLASIRAGLREEMQNSALMDEPGFTCKVEAAYRAMWLKWCDVV
ncbi:MAG: tetratricopeptide repeat protein [Burkholderiales bacterium]|nr:tetratricopeptide repeat protein [Burkholderiales bacterium]MBI3729020.1 tetratricopeptide repeat protein [Burkholderiales bacterium]